MSKDNPRGPARIELKGRYLQAVSDYVDTVESGPQGFKFNDELRRLQATVAELHPSISDSHAFSLLLRLVHDFQFAHPTALGPLRNTPLAAELVSRIKGYIESLPRMYCLRIYLPKFPVLLGHEVVLSNRMRIVSDFEHALNPTDSDYGALANALSKRVSPNDQKVAVLEISASGYADANADSPAFADCIALAKRFAFWTYAYGPGKSSYKFGPAPRAHIVDKESDQIINVQLPSSVQRSLEDLAIDLEKLQVSDPNGTTLLSFKPADTDAERVLALEIRFSGFRRLANQIDGDAESVATAIEWYQDSIFAENQTIAYLSACIGIEALVGSSKGQMTDMSDRLADRLAYMLGAGRRDREELAQSYRNILTVRGGLVHARAPRLSVKGVDNLHKAQELLRRAIHNDVVELSKGQPR